MRLPRHNQLNFDSLVDLVSNYLGILILIIIVGIIVLGDIKFSFLYDLPTVGTTKKEEVLFICQNNRIRGLDIEKLRRGADPDFEWVLSQDYSSYHVVPRVNSFGEDPQQIKLENSKFRNALKNIDTGNEFPVFLVVNDSWEIFTDALAMWRDQNSASYMWYPYTMNDGVTFYPAFSGSISEGIEENNPILVK